MFKKLLLLAFISITFASCYVSYSDDGPRRQRHHYHHSRERGRDHR